MNWRALLDMLVPVLGAKAVEGLHGQLESLTQGADEGWKKAVLSLLADAVEKHGPAGIQIAQQAIHDLLEGKPVEIDWADLATASDIMAHLQNAEADKKSAARDFMAKASETVGVILSGLIKGLVA